MIGKLSEQDYRDRKCQQFKANILENQSCVAKAVGGVQRCF